MNDVDTNQSRHDSKKGREAVRQYEEQRKKHHRLKAGHECRWHGHRRELARCNGARRPLLEHSGQVYPAAGVDEKRRLQHDGPDKNVAIGSLDCEADRNRGVHHKIEQDVEVTAEVSLSVREPRDGAINAVGDAVGDPERQSDAPRAACCRAGAGDAKYECEQRDRVRRHAAEQGGKWCEQTVLDASQIVIEHGRVSRR